ncbi:MAG: MlaD family protein [Burkholderiaceae bacterium]|jgi:phospholipid/cholesterol/gamma-HCH transport system substrate-binding protein|nr:MlaD family protein [Burkholderiaceae bacterium]
MENKSHALAAGVFVLAVTAMLIGLAAWLMRDTASTTAYQISTSEAVSGLQSQASVRYRGLTVGKVTDIGFDPDARGNVLVTLAVSKDAPITRSTYAQLAYQGVTGLSFVHLDDDGGGSAEPPERYQGGPPRIPLRPSLFGQWSDRAQELVGKLGQSADRINQLLGDDNQAALSDAIKQTAQAARGVRALADDTRKTLETQLGPSHVDIPQLIRQTATAMAAVQDAAAQTERAAASLNDVATGMKQGMRELAGQDGAIGRLGQTMNTFSADTLPRVQALTEDAGHAIRRLDHVAGAIDDNPQTLIYGNGPIAPGPGEPGFAPPRPAQPTQP